MEERWQKLEGDFRVKRGGNLFCPNSARAGVEVYKTTNTNRAVSFGPPPKGLSCQRGQGDYTTMENDHVKES